MKYHLESCPYKTWLLGLQPGKTQNSLCCAATYMYESIYVAAFWTRR